MTNIKLPENNNQKTNKYLSDYAGILIIFPYPVYSSFSNITGKGSVHTTLLIDYLTVSLLPVQSREPLQGYLGMESPDESINYSRMHIKITYGQ
jgi:uncharacterized membrane protein